MLTQVNKFHIKRDGKQATVAKKENCNSDMCGKVRRVELYLFYLEGFEGISLQRREEYKQTEGRKDF